jgi:hypothetical protein
MTKERRNDNNDAAGTDDCEPFYQLFLKKIFSVTSCTIENSNRSVENDRYKSLPHSGFRRRHPVAEYK